MFVKPMESVAFSCFLLFHDGCRFKAQFIEMLLHCNICTQPGTKAHRERVGDVIVEAQNFRWFWPWRDARQPRDARHSNLCFRGHVRKRIRWCQELKEAFGKSQRPSCPTNCRGVHGDTMFMPRFFWVGNEVKHGLLSRTYCLEQEFVAWPHLAHLVVLPHGH